ncbi:MAG: hypothetical protein AAGB22_08595, partial [Bacteroidota bacterium]
MRQSLTFPSVLIPRNFCLFLALTLIAWPTVSSQAQQSKEEKRLLSKAVDAYEDGDYKKAKEQYNKLLELVPTSAEYNYLAGQAYFESSVQREQAIDYLEKALQHSGQDTIPEIYYYLGRANQYLSRFDIAIEAYRDFQRLKEKDKNPGELVQDVQRYIEMCENGKGYFENNREFVVVENLGKNINSEYPEYSPVVKEDESLIIFTSRRPNTTGGDIYYGDNKYYEDVYISRYVNNAWVPAYNLDTTNKFLNVEVNTEEHDAVISFDAKETTLYLYREEDIWTSEFIDGEWQFPLRLNQDINTEKGSENHIYISDDRMSMFVVSERKDSYGGRDIYVARKERLSSPWGPLENLGPDINTRYDEDAPFVTPDGNTLYFSSRGHNSMGGFDVFKSELINGRWGKPEIVGIQINTPGDEIYFITNNVASIGYYASSRKGGYGDMDIYRISLTCKTIRSTEIRGLIVSEDLKRPVGGTITITDARTGEEVGGFNAHPESGKYAMRL